VTTAPVVTITMTGAELRVAEAADPLELWQALRSFFQNRGRAMKTSASGYRYPETSNREVRAVADLLDRVERRFSRDDLHGQASERTRWREGRAEVDALTTAGDPSAVYAKNERFWTYYAKHLCVFLSAASEMQTRSDRAREAFTEAVAALPETLSRAASVTADVAGGTLDAISDAAGDLGEGLARPIKRTLGELLGPYVLPALIGGGALAAVLVVPRLVPTRRGAS
jgi:hypothetical protein